MPAERLIFQELFEIVWHSDQVELDLPVLEMNSCRVNVSENHVLLMDMVKTAAKLPEN